MRKTASVYEYAGKRVFISASKTTVGFWIQHEPILSCVTDDPHEIGRLVRLCLAASGEGLPPPTSGGAAYKKLVALAGAKSMTAFGRTAKCVGIDVDGDVVSVAPMRNVGPRSGFVRFSEAIQIASNSKDAELGSTVINALALAE